VVNIGDGIGGTLLQVTHDYHPIAGTPYLYEVDVSIKNLSGSDLVAGDLVYRRVMDWDIPYPGVESVTIQGVPALLGIANGSNLYRSDNNGFNSGDPFSFSSYGLQNTNFTNSESGNLQGSVSNDQGALFDFEFEALANGATRTFSTFYGVAPTVALADLARSQVDGDASDVDIGLYSYGTCTSGLSDFTCASVTGEPNTFIFGFGGTGGTLDPNPTVPEPLTLSLLGLGLAGLGLRRRKQEQTATLA
jgi:type IV pilus assembly protein PilY1